MTLPLTPFEIYGDTRLIKDKKPICITFGNFDGVHLGHQYLLSFMKKKAGDTPLVVVTFNPHSSDFFNQKAPKNLLTSLEDKVMLLLKAGVDAVIVQKFDDHFAALCADEFCENWLNSSFCISSVILGHDFCYGKNRQGNYAHMHEFGRKKGWEVIQLAAFETPFTKNKPVSSSLIREEIALGHLENVESLLGRPYFLSGVVVPGDMRGRVLGFPTANLKPATSYAIPKYGVYACLVEINPSFYASEPNSILLPAVMNCGVRPSVGEGLKPQIEAHILNFNEDIYGKKIRFYLKYYIRGEMKFSGIEQLKEQISLDAAQAHSYFKLS